MAMGLISDKPEKAQGGDRKKKRTSDQANGLAFLQRTLGRGDDHIRAAISKRKAEAVCSPSGSMVSTPS